MEFGDKIRFLRRLKGWNQNDLATRAGMSGPYLNQIERGKNLESIGENLVKRLADVLEVSVEDLINPESTISYNSNNAFERNTSISQAEISFEAERKVWQSLEASLRQTIANQQETINFLMDLVKKK
ncbi:MAG: helix-turn-helix transcriptional regulator [Spirosomataceae bacterium]